MSTTFRVVNWAPNELVGEDKMDQLNANTEWLFRNTPRAEYTLPSGLRRDTGIKIASGLVRFPPSKLDNAVGSVRFGNFFSVNCEPIITTGVYTNGTRKFFAVVSGFGTLKPDHRGFQAGVKIEASYDKNDKFESTVYVSWIALGY